MGGGGPIASTGLPCGCLVAVLVTGGGGGAINASGIGSGEIESVELSLPDPVMWESSAVSFEIRCAEASFCACWAKLCASSGACERADGVFFLTGFILGDSRTTRAELHLVTTDFLLPDVEASFLFMIGNSEDSIGDVAFGVVACDDM